MFRNRIDAGRRLVEELKGLGWNRMNHGSLLVLSIPRGGVVVGKEVAVAIGCEHEVMVAKKVGCPGQEELAIGAVAEDGEAVMDKEVIEGMGLSELLVTEQVKQAKKKVAEYVGKYRGRKELELGDKEAVVLVDDGVATGWTMKAGIEWLREKREKEEGDFKVVVAVPVCARQTYEELLTLVDAVVCVEVADNMAAIGQYFRNFEQVSDEVVMDNLDKDGGISTT